MPLFLAAARRDIPASTSAAAAASFNAEVRGLPIFFPSWRALAMPALVRSMSRVRSCSATQPKMGKSSPLPVPAL